MSKSTEKVKVTLSHNQEIDGKPRKAGEKVEIDARLARALKARGSAQIDETKTKTPASAEKGGK
ncbi:MAG TPA: hypothetical protein VK039_09010 [Brevibacterium sp.]|nr:hypothetical protein [Brevibacterium sp.]